MREPNNLILQRYATGEKSDSLLGLLFLGDEFICYTLESYNLRIKEGTYNLGIRKELTPLTRRFRLSRSYNSWFEYFIEVEDVKNRSHLYFHGANKVLDGEGNNILKGCIAPGDRPFNPILHKYSDLAITDSAKSMEYLYGRVYHRLERGEKMSISIYNTLNK